MPFKNPLTTLILPDGAAGAPRIILDGTTGIITSDGVSGDVIIDPNEGIQAISGNGAQIIIDPNGTYPEIRFTSQDGTNEAFLNITGGPGDADLGINSGRFTPADGVVRRGRMYFNGAGVDQLLTSVMRDVDQSTFGGFTLLTSTYGSLGYWNETGAELHWVIVDGATDRIFLLAPSTEVQGDLFVTSSVAPGKLKAQFRFTTTVSTGGTEFMGAQLTFAAIAGIRYRVDAGLQVEASAAGQFGVYRFRWAAGNSVTITDTVIVARGKGFPAPDSDSFYLATTWVPNVTGNVTVGITLQTTGGAGTTKIVGGTNADSEIAVYQVS